MIKRRLFGLGFDDRRVPGHVAPERIKRVGANLREAVELELDKKCRGRCGRAGDKLLGCEAYHPAATSVFETGQTLDKTVVARRVVYPTYPVPALTNRVLPGKIVLVKLPAQVSVIETKLLVFARRPARTNIGPLNPAYRRVVIDPRIDRNCRRET